MKKLLIILFFIIHSSLFISAQHPNLILTKDGVETIKKSLGKYPLFEKSYNEAFTEVEQNIKDGIQVPIPKEAGGGYTHEKHKANYNAMYKAGILWQVTGNKKYAEFVKEMLMQYAKIYPSLSIHPEGSNSSSPGKLFWQSLNDAVWLVNAIQAYDCIYDFCSAKERKTIESELFRNAAKFNMEDCYKVFNQIHNHGAWNVAGVMMTAFVLRDAEMLEKCYYGSNKDGKTGFYALVNGLYSPDGYYIEGPYYLRYAYWPFGLTATVIENNQPEKQIFAYKDSVLLKAPLALLQMTDPTGHFLPFNDAIREKAWTSQEVISAVDIAYLHTQNTDLLYVAKIQDFVMLSKEGIAVAKAIAEGKASKDFSRKSILLRDGTQGNEGGVGILRSGEGKDQLSLVMKYGVYGMEHGHFDKLTMMLYDQNKSIFNDYGAVRYLNIEQKRGGRYLPENKTWGKQTIAHNTVTVDMACQYKGNAKTADDKHSESYYFDASNPNLQVMSAYDSTANQGVTMQRTMAMADNFIIDIFRLKSDKKHIYDLPFYYSGTLIETNVGYIAHPTWEAFGTKNGYQHLFNTAEGTSKDSNLLFTFYL
ncbi:MAG: heparinase II/III family protein, partial [Bacteroidales bacterium]|nr:heparinase II/III family protein [Bacteroidales bacterium]